MVGEQVVVWMRQRTFQTDVAVASALIVVCGLVGVLVHAGADYFVFSAALLAPLAFRRRSPEWSAVAVGVVALAQWLTIRNTTGALLADIAVPLAVYTLAAHGDTRASRIGLAAGLCGAVLGGWSWPQLPLPTLAHVLVGGFLAGTVAAAWLGGAWQRARRSELTALSERAELAERDLEHRTRLAVLSERTRIARDIHDILAHSLAVIIAQSDGGRYAARAEPRRAVDALTAIGEQGRAALAETRRALGVLRDDATDHANPTPAPGLSDLPRLVDEVRGTGLPVTLTVDLHGADLDAGIGLVAYRVVQEGLTNIVKHAGYTAPAEVSVQVEADLLRISVTDNGRPETVTAATGLGGSGYGLVGMRERVGAYGGDIALRQRPGGYGHVLDVRIPLERSR
ncbi:sensor histidine kinase [Nocardia sp. 2]|uniref:histidine kinase n=1 Tax=Nocardia acididurans TaxID=2802282 RepID=A0ABS1MGL0_9NOCA|nr:histidine kinase [Nocardia acididurans]MBL1079195.1 sensor histidine kinase [Nocardia acididurans]